MDEKKPSTADILAKIRAQKAAASATEAPTPAAPAEPAAAAEPAVPVSAAPPAAAAAATPAAKPGSTKDILAAIRAKGAVGSAPATAAPAATSSAASPTAPAAAKPTPAAAGPRPSVQDMLKAVREGKAGAMAAAPAASASTAKAPVVVPPMPTKPVMSSKKATQPRRGFLTTALVIACAPFSTAFNLAWTCITAVTGIATLGTARFMFPNVLVEPPSKFKVGPASDYPLNSVSNKWKDQYGIWIVHTDQYEGRNLVFALASVCTHLGCTPSWLDGEQKFKCPCHGSGFYMTGVNFEGPAPRPLERVGLRVAEGMLEVDKSVKFQEEMGQWSDAASFVEMV